MSVDRLDNLNETLVRSLQELSVGGSSSASPEWNEEEDSESDCWTFYQQDVATQLSAQSQQIYGNGHSVGHIRENGNTRNTHIIRKVTCTKGSKGTDKGGECSSPPNNPNCYDNGTESTENDKERPDKSKNYRCFDDLKTPQIIINAKFKSNQKIPIVQKEALSKCKRIEFERDKDSFERKFDARIRPIELETPTKIVLQNPLHILAKNKPINATPRSPFFNRKFDSVSPKRKAKGKTNRVVVNKSLALSLECKLDKQSSKISQLKEEEDEGISSDDDSKDKDSVSTTRVRGPIRRSTYLKREARPKGEALLDSLDLVSGSVQSLATGQQRKPNESLDNEHDGERKDGNKLDEKNKPNFAFIRVSTTST